MEQIINCRDFSSISPSAKWMILCKGHTNIPYAREEAEIFFKNNGFVIDKIATVNYSEMSSFKYFKRSLTLRHLFKMRNTRQIFATWQLKAV